VTTARRSSVTSGEQREWPGLAVSPDDAVAAVASGMRIFVHGAAATPTPLLYALARRTDLRDVTLYHLHTEGPAPFADADQRGRLQSISLFAGAPVRAAIARGDADCIPIFLSDIPGLFASGQVPLDLAILQLSPPDAHGFCTLGTSVDAALAAAQHARLVVAEINERMPRTHGNTLVPFSRLHAFTHTSRPLHAHAPPPRSAVDEAIGEHVAALVEDGATLQTGIGAIPDAVLARLQARSDLGVHTEMFSDGLVALVRSGAVTNRFKHVHRGRVVTSFVNGSRTVYDFVDDNPLVEFHPCDRTNDTSIIARNPKVTAINSALEVDLSGQVAADSLGFQIYSGIGGQMDFMRGAARSEGGKPIIALPSTAAGGRASRIVLALKPGAGVVTTRGHVHWVATEYGAVNLFGLSLRQRAEALIRIAHPDVRGELAREYREVRHVVIGSTASGAPVPEALRP
jgi:4-hydroxybutyrate CoA-transferase